MEFSIKKDSVKPRKIVHNFITKLIVVEILLCGVFYFINSSVFVWLLLLTVLTVFSRIIWSILRTDGTELTWEERLPKVSQEMLSEMEEKDYSEVRTLMLLGVLPCVEKEMREFAKRVFIPVIREALDGKKDHQM